MIKNNGSAYISSLLILEFIKCHHNTDISLIIYDKSQLQKYGLILALQLTTVQSNIKLVLKKQYNCM